MNDRLLRGTAATFLVAVAVHGGDHARRGIEIPSRLATAGASQFLVGVVAVVLVFRAHRLAPLAAIAVGFPSALLFAHAHLLPQGIDPFTGANAAAGVTAFSWFTALAEIAADLAFGWAGVVMLRSRGIDSAAAPARQVA